jgi:hypothetical protein
MSKLQAWFCDQPYSFQAGYQDYRGGEQFSVNRNAEWQRGWNWANTNNFSRSR